jgi:hypothetical protein
VRDPSYSGAARGNEAALDRIHESVLSFDLAALEYKILLTTGGPSLRIFGWLDKHRQPASAELQMQDWGMPWHRYPAPEATLLAFTQAFYFGS